MQNERHYLTCPDCDALNLDIEVPDSHRAHCYRCDAELYRQQHNKAEKIIVYSLTALLCFILANLFPFMTLQSGGLEQQTQLFSGSLALLAYGYPALGALVFVTSELFPLLVILALLYTHAPQHWPINLPATLRVYRVLQHLLPWSLLGVFMLGVIVAMIKLLDLAAIIAGPSLFSLAAMLIFMLLALSAMDSRHITGSISLPHSQIPTQNIEHHDLLSCHSCRLILPSEHQGQACPRCGSKIHKRKPDSLAKTWALVVTAAMLYIPANLYPIMTVQQFGIGSADTIISGVISLIDANMLGIALLVLFASVIVPMLKLLALAFLLISVQRGSVWRQKDRTRLYRITEWIGAWSMLDIFLIGILVSLVQMNSLATISPEPGAIFFAAVVIMTMFAAHSFDPRLIWDKHNE